MLKYLPGTNIPEESSQAGQGVLYRTGRSIGPYDMMLAAQARAFGLILVTNNVEEFGRVPGLVLEDWSKE